MKSKKKDLLCEARQIMKNKNYSTSSVDDILMRFDHIFDMNTPVEQELKQQYNEIIEKNNRNKRQWENNAEQKESFYCRHKGFSIRKIGRLLLPR